MMRIFLTVAINVANCVRSFSKLKIIENYLRSTMSTLQLRNITTLSTERQLRNKIVLDDVIAEFANKKARKIVL